jgi:hypothetical protein
MSGEFVECMSEFAFVLRDTLLMLNERVVGQVVICTLVYLSYS